MKDPANPVLKSALDPDLAKKILQEHRKRSKQDLLAGLYPHQKAFINDSHRFKAILGDRRAGKSTALGHYLVKTALDHPGSTSLYLGLTYRSAVFIMNKDVLDVIRKDCRLEGEMTWISTNSEWKFKNGSIIRLMGADAHIRSIQKAVGQKYKLAIFDEAGLFRNSLHDMVYRSILPAMAEEMGTIVLCGTPSNYTSGLFYEATTKDIGWHLHHFSWRNNKARLKEIQSTHDEIIRQRGTDYMQSSTYRQEWNGEWVIDNVALVYRYTPDRNQAEELPHPAEEYTWLLGVDLGHKDGSAFTIGAYHPRDPVLYIVHAYKESGLINSQIAQIIYRLWKGRPHPKLDDVDLTQATEDWLSICKQTLKVYPFARIVADEGALGLMIATDMRKRLGLPIEAAQKTQKKGAIDLFNSDLLQGRIKVLPSVLTFRGEPGKPKNLVEEWESLIWDERALAQVPPRHKEDPRQRNDLCFVAGTLIETDRGALPIETLSPGDLVLTRNGYKPVSASGPTGTFPTYLLTTDNTELEGTANHPVYVEDTWIPLADLKTHQRLQHALPWLASVATDAMPRRDVDPASTTKPALASNVATTAIPRLAVADDRVRDVQPTGQEKIVYNLTVADTHEYFANGILVHNCDSALYLSRAARNYITQPEPTKDIDPHSEDYHNEWIRKFFDRNAKEQRFDGWIDEMQELYTIDPERHE